MRYHLILKLVLHQKLRYFYFFLSICTDEFISALKLMTFFPMLPPVNENYK